MRAGVLLMVLGAALAGLSGCDPATTTGTQALVQQPSDSSSLLPFARDDARMTVAHTGVRRIELLPASGPKLVFLERIATDGQGRYSIEPTTLLESTSVEWEWFELLQRAREGFSFRYRDFLVRDPALFARNWRTTEMDGVSIAGRACARLRLERIVGDPIGFELSVDESGLVLASLEFDARGELRASMVYETLQLGLPRSGVVWHETSNAEESLDVRADFTAQVVPKPLRPRILPAGYGLLEASWVSAAEGEDRWLKLVYSDGIEPLFFLQKPADAQPLTAHLEAAGRGDSTAPSAVAPPSAVVVFQVGSALAIQGQVNGHDLIVVGKARQAELLDLIESALP